MVNGTSHRPRVLLVSMYPLDQGAWGPTVRITHLRDELARMVELDVVAGYRGVRSLALLRYALARRLRGLQGVYVESSTFLPSPADLAFLALGRAMGIPILTYVRDAYQLFPEYYPIDSVRRRLSSRIFLPTMRSLVAVSKHGAFPSRGLERAVLGRDGRSAIIPPGSRRPVDIQRDPAAKALLYVGDARHDAQGGPRLVEAVRLTRERGVDLRLIVVTRRGQEPAGPLPSWMSVCRGEHDAIERLLPDVLATVIPRPRGPYNDLAVPVKLFDYLSYGRPLLVTDCVEQAAIVREAGAGIVTSDRPAAMADAMVRLAFASDEEIAAWSEGARRAAVENSWKRRADQVLDALGIGS